MNKVAEHNIKNKEWDIVISSDNASLSLRLNELWRYRDLIFLFVRRDFVSQYKQTILGPFWYIIQPLMTTLTFSVVFGNIAKLSTDGLPRILFYMSGIIAWGYFSSCLQKTSGTFIANNGIFSKVYFPRMVMPVSVVVSNLISFGIQLLTFLCFLTYFLLFTNVPVHPNAAILLLPFLVLLMAMLGLGFGIIISSMTTKYRDLTYFVGFGVQLLMYASPVIFPWSTVSGKLKYLLLANPMTPVIELMRYAFLGTGTFNFWYLGITVIYAIVVLTIGMLMFNRVEKIFTDHV